MNLVINEIAEFLKISAEKAEELYPAIRTQWIWYSTLYDIRLLFFVPVISCSVIASLLYLLSVEDNNIKQIKLRFYGKRLIFCAIIFFVLYVLTSILITIMAPDLTLMKNILN